MRPVKTLCVYCGSSSRVDDIYKDIAGELGRVLAQGGIDVVYGGGHVGLMGIVADAALAHGGKVTGIIPRFLNEKEIQHENLTDLHVVDSMHERKLMMADKADGYVVLPGGFGTLDEFFEILTWRQLQLHDKPIVMVNTGGYWEPLLTMMDRIVQSGFARQAHRECFQVVEEPAAILDVLSSWKYDIQDLQKDWT